MSALAPDPAVREVTTHDGTVLLDAEHGRLYGLNPTGSTVWQGLTAGRSVDQIVGELTARFTAPPEQLRSDVEAVITQLRDHGLLHISGA